MSLRFKTGLMCIAMLANVGAISYVGEQSIERVLSLSKLDDVNKLVQSHMENDMMHDAIDGDVMKAMSALSRADGAALSEIANDLKEHTATAAENMAKIKQIAMPDGLRQQIENTAIQFNTYTATAAKMLESAQQDMAGHTKTAEARYDEFQASFKEVEAAMAGISDSIEAWSSEIKASAIHDAELGKQELHMIVAIAIALTLFMLIHNELAMFRPQKRLLGIAQRLMNNDVSVDVPFDRRKDEVGQFSKLLVAMKTMTEDKVRTADQFEQKVKSIVDHVASAATEMGASAAEVAQNIGSNSARMGELNSNMRSTSSNIQGVASAVGQLSASISEIRRQVAESAKINTMAVEQSEQINAISQELSGSIQAVGDITKIIAVITNQINLLSLNATIEAARAGDAGKGFAVVAAEVKDLASQTAKSTGDISAQIAVIQETANRTLESMSRIASVIQQIDHVSTTIAAAIEQQGQATESITRNIEEAARSTNGVAEHVSSVSGMAERTGSDAAEMQKVSAGLAKQAEILRQEVDTFLIGMRGSKAA